MILDKTYIYAIISTLLALFGFKVNNETAIIGAMMVSPILKPITSVFKSKHTSTDNIINALIKMLKLSIMIFSIATVFSVINNYIGFYNQETSAMSLRLEKQQIINEYIASCIVGVGVAYAVSENNAIARTGLTLGITLIPMLALSGLYFGNYIYNGIVNKLSTSNNNTTNNNATNNNTTNNNAIDNDTNNNTFTDKLENDNDAKSLQIFVIYAVNLLITTFFFIITTRYVLRR
jgi:hypothetical protein